MNFSALRIRSASGWTIAIFGLLALILGLIGLIQPEITLQILNFPITENRAEGDFTVLFLTASSMASFNMGIYYLLAALSDWKAFFRWTVPFRILTFIIFSLLVLRGIAPLNFIGVALWELIGAIATGLALFFERSKDNSPDSH